VGLAAASGGVKYVDPGAGYRPTPALAESADPIGLAITVGIELINSKLTVGLVASSVFVAVCRHVLNWSGQERETRPHDAFEGEAHAAAEGGARHAQKISGRGRPRL
jgi:hypothetical protein